MHKLNASMKKYNEMVIYHRQQPLFSACFMQKNAMALQVPTIFYIFAKNLQNPMADNSILIRLDGLKLKYAEIGQKLTDPEVIADVKQFVQLTKDYK